MTRPGQWRRRGKWAGTVAAVVIAGVWVWSGWRFVAWLQTWGSNEEAMVSIGTGCISGSYRRDTFPMRPKADLHINTIPPIPRWFWWFHYQNKAASGGSVRLVTMSIPLWLPFALVALPTALLWYLDRRRPPGSCPRCGYDLSGVPGGVCPECGRARS